MSDVKKIRPNTEQYEKSRTADGKLSQHSGDVIATGLAGATLDEVFEVAEALKAGGDEDLRKKYAHLNPGQQRMNLGNRIRGAVKALNVAKEGNGDAVFAKIADKLQKVVAGREKDAEKAKVAEAKEAAVARAAKTEKPAKADPLKPSRDAIAKGKTEKPGKPVTAAGKERPRKRA